MRSRKGQDKFRNVTILGCLYIFLSAFLLFEIQPLMSKHLLPPFGGVPAVWLTCMLFFQAVLLGGYLYAHITTERLRPRAQIAVHILLMIASVLFLPWALPQAPAPSGPPNLAILALLTITVGLPYFVLSTTSPLLQRWMALREMPRGPYWLYSISNLGSLGALVSYPLLTEPASGLASQTRIWSFAYLLFIALGCLTALIVTQGLKTGGLPASEESRSIQVPPFNAHLFWFLQAACGSLLLYSFTAVLATDIAPVPLVWIAPLVVYLITFILTFHSARWFNPRLYAVLLLALYLIFLLFQSAAVTPTLAAEAGLILGLLFACCMICHGALAAGKPDPRFLTGYYLTISAGGVAGGIFSSLIAPVLFTDYIEFPVGILGSIAILASALVRRGKQAPPRSPRMLTVVVIIIVIAAVLLRTSSLASGAILRTRNFFGVLKVTEIGKDRDKRRVLSHGSTVHGFQFLDSRRRKEKTSYFGDESGVGLTFSALKDRPPMRVGVIGLGAGTIAAYGRPGDQFSFFEIDPQVEPLARKYFSFLDDSAASVRVDVADGRLAIGRFAPETFDVLVIDAFSGGSIPIHLLTSEAFSLYHNTLKRDGALVLHLSNKYVDLTPAVSAQAKHLNLSGCLIIDPGREGLTISSLYALLGRDLDVCSLPPIKASVSRAPFPAALSRRWTDDYSSVFPLLKLRVQ